MSIHDQVRTFILETFYAPESLRDDASLLDTGTIDSTGVLELIGFVEERFGVKVGDRDIHPDNFDSIDRIVAFVERKPRREAPANDTGAHGKAGSAPLPPASAA